MAGLAYLLPPLTGLWAFLRAPDAATRAHGFQSIVLGAAWPAALYLASFVTPGLTQIVFLVFAGAWLVLMVAAAGGRGWIAPGLEARLEAPSRDEG